MVDTPTPAIPFSPNRRTGASLRCALFTRDLLEFAAHQKKRGPLTCVSDPPNPHPPPHSTNPPAGGLACHTGQPNIAAASSAPTRAGQCFLTELFWEFVSIIWFIRPRIMPFPKPLSRQLVAPKSRFPASRFHGNFNALVLGAWRNWQTRRT